MSVIVFLYLDFMTVPKMDHIRISDGLPPVRIAHCFVGGARTLYLPETYQLYAKQVLHPIQAQHDIFMVMDLEQGLKGAKTIQMNRTHYDRALAYLKPIRVVWVEDAPPFSGEFDPSDFYYKWSVCAKLFETVELLNGTRYDYVIKTRPDLIVLRELPPMNKWPQDKVWINPYYEYAGDIPEELELTTELFRTTSTNGYSDPNEMPISDIFGIVPRKYASIYFNVVRNDEHICRRFCGNREGMLECRLKTSLGLANVSYEIAPVVVKIRRSFQNCESFSNSVGLFNSLC